MRVAPRRQMRGRAVLAAALLAGATACSGGDDGALDDEGERIDIVIVGDSYTEGVIRGGLDDANWTARLTDLLRNDGLRVRVRVEAGGGSGYVATGWRNLTFGQMADAVVDDSTDVVIVLGSINDMFDGADRDAVREAASAVYSSIRRASPGASLLIVGPSPTGDEVPRALHQVSRGVATAASEVGATFVDPIAEGWFSGDDAALMSDDDLHPTDDGHRYMARQLVDDVEALIAARAGN